MKIPFVAFGTDEFAVTVFEALRERGLVPSLVVTETDKPKGRGQKLSAPPLKLWAQKHNIPISQPNKLDVSFYSNLQSLNSNFYVVASYGKLLPKKLLEIPANGVLNIHPSLLPRYRGPSPIQSQIIADDRETGVTIMLLDEKMDHGPIVAQKNVLIESWPPKTSDAMHVLAQAGANLLADVLPNYLSGEIKPKPQDDSKATFTKKFTKADELINLSGDPHLIWRTFQALGETPGVYFTATKNGKVIHVKIEDAYYEKGTFVPTSVIPENRRKMSYSDFLRGLVHAD